MSDLRDIKTESNEIRDISNKGLSTNFKLREMSIGEVVSCNKKKNYYLVRLLDEEMSVVACLSGHTSNLIFKSLPRNGDLVLIAHKSTSDALILDILDKQRFESITENTDSSIKNNSNITSAQGA